jgi:cellobiose-specific phosphotransferase system component IIA
MYSGDPDLLRMKKGRVMSVGFALVLFAGAAVNENMAATTNVAPTEAQTAPATFNSYTQAYHAAQKSRLPMIVILNPGKNTQTSLISMEDVQKTRERRNLLQNYVVAVVDTTTPHGQKVYALFGSPQLPMVSVIDNQQATQVYQTSATMYGQMWDQILTSFINASPAAPPMPAPNYCPYCQQRGY